MNDSPDRDVVVFAEALQLPSGERSIDRWFDPGAFVAPAQYVFGNSGRNILRGPGTKQLDISLFKSFVFSETRGSRLEFRAETFNTFNHTQFNQVSNNLGSGNFGQFTSAFDPRIMQLGLKLYF